MSAIVFGGVPPQQGTNGGGGGPGGGGGGQAFGTCRDCKAQLQLVLNEEGPPSILCSAFPMHRLRINLPRCTQTVAVTGDHRAEVCCLPGLVADTLAACLLLHAEQQRCLQVCDSTYCACLPALPLTSTLHLLHDAICADQLCPHCGHGPVRQLSFRFRPGLLPPGFPPALTCCVVSADCGLGLCMRNPDACCPSYFPPDPPSLSIFAQSPALLPFSFCQVCNQDFKRLLEIVGPTRRAAPPQQQQQQQPYGRGGGGGRGGGRGPAAAGGREGEGRGAAAAGRGRGAAATGGRGRGGRSGAAAGRGRGRGRGRG